MKAVTGRRDDPGKPGLFVLSLWTINALHAADPDPAISLIPVPGESPTSQARSNTRAVPTRLINLYWNRLG